MSHLAKKIRTAASLSFEDWYDLSRAWILLLWVDLGLRRRPFQQVQARAAQTAVSRPPADRATPLKRLPRLVDAAARNHLYPMTCLRRSLVLQRLLAGRGLPSSLRFGVLKTEGDLVAHAWVEVDGRPIGEPEQLTQQYALLVSQAERTG